MKTVIYLLALVFVVSCSKSSVAPTVQPTVTASYTVDSVNKVFILTAIVTDPSHISTGGTWEIQNVQSGTDFYFSSLATTDSSNVYTAKIPFQSNYSGYATALRNGSNNLSLFCMFALSNGSSNIEEVQVYPVIN